MFSMMIALIQKSVDDLYDYKST